MKAIRVAFADFWPGFDPSRNFVCEILATRYEVVISSEPEYLFYSDFGRSHLRSDCVKIYLSGENTAPDFNFCDYAVSHHYLEFGDRHLRVPLAVLWSEYPPRTPNLDDSPADRRFCNFVYSNGFVADPFRLEFFRRLSEYRSVDSGGRMENNIGGPIDDKMDFISQYKFTIAFENSAVDGYTTEKILDAMQAGSIPIYWGDPRVDLSFNVESFVWVRGKSEDALVSAIEEIKRLDNDVEAYNRKLEEPWIRPDQFVDHREQFGAFLFRIVDQELEQARRVPCFGRAPLYRQHLIRLLQRAEDFPLPRVSFRVRMRTRVRQALRLLLNGR